MSETGPFAVRVETPETKGQRGSRYAPKGRSFGAQLVALQMAQGYWENSDTDPLRPTFALFACSRQEAIPFLANLRKGYKLYVDGIGYKSRGGWPVEFLRGADYEYNLQHVQGGSLIEVFLRPLYEFKPGMSDPDQVCFLMAVSQERLRVEGARFPTEGLDAAIASVPFKPTRHEGEPFDRETVVAEAVRFGAALHERGLVPVPPEPIFCVRLLLSAIQRGFAKRNQRAKLGFSPNDSEALFCEFGMAMAKRAPGLAFCASQRTVAEWLAEEVRAATIGT